MNTGPVSPLQTDAPEPAHTGEGPRTPLSLAAILWYSLANFGYGAFYALNNAVIPLFLETFTKDARILGIMASTHSFEGAIIQPIVGTASDKLRTPWGRRRPFMIVFIPLTAVFLVLTPLAGGLPPEIRLGGVMAAIFVFTIFYNVAADPYQALMPDITPVPQRGRVAAISVFVLLLGQILFLLLDVPMAAKFMLVAGVMVVTTFLTCLMVREPKHPAGETRSHHPLKEAAVALRGLRTLAQARKSLLAGFFSGLGIGAVFPFLTVFVKEITGATDSQALRMFMVLMLATAVGVLPFGWLSDRIGPKRVVILGLGLIGIAAVCALWVTTLSQITLVMALAGLGNAARSASAYPLLTELVPGEEIGFYTGLQTTALSIATPLTAVLTGWLVNISRTLTDLPFEGFRVIFLVCALCIFVSMAVLSAVHQNRAAVEIAARDRERIG